MNKTNIIRTIYYYQIICNNNLFEDSPSLINDLNNIKENETYIVKLKNKNIKIEICSFDEDYLFGRCAKEDDLNNGFIRKINNSRNEITPFELPEDEYLETFTYFCIKFKKAQSFDKMVSMSNNKIKNINTIIESFIKSNSSKANIEIIQESIDDLEAKLKNLTIKKINLKFFNDKFLDEYSPLKDILLGTNLLKEISIDISFNSNKNLWSKIKSIFKNDYRKVNLIVNNIDDAEENINLLNNTFSKKMSLQIEKGSEFDQNQIFEILKKEL